MINASHIGWEPGCVLIPGGLRVFSGRDDRRLVSEGASNAGCTKALHLQRAQTLTGLEGAKTTPTVIVTKRLDFRLK